MLSSDRNPLVLIKTSLGDVTVEVFEDKAPLTSNNFLRYVDGKMYDGTSFFRTVTMGNQLDSEVKIEVIQGGRVQPESSYPPIGHETTQETNLKHIDGTISMARREPGSATSSFFLCIGDQPELDFGGRRNPDGQGFAAFGRVVDGMGIVRLIHGQPAEGQRLKRPVEIIAVRRIN